jgi:hypothetical protein
MKNLFLFLALILSPKVFAESPIAIEPILLKELFAQAGTLEVEDSFGERNKLSDVLGEAMSYSFDDEEITVEHLCDLNAESWDCTLRIRKITFGLDAEPSDESSTMIRYSANYDNKTGEVTIISVGFDKLGN